MLCVFELIIKRKQSQSREEKLNVKLSESAKSKTENQALFEKRRNAQLTGLFVPFFVAQPCHTQSMPAVSRLNWRKNPSPFVPSAIFQTRPNKRRVQPAGLHSSRLSEASGKPRFYTAWPGIGRRAINGPSCWSHWLCSDNRYRLYC